jgi:hypothetical protein
MSRSLFLLAISVLAACGDDGSSSCGPGGAASDGLTAGNGSDVSLVYENLTSGQNHDCPDSSQTAVESITIIGSQKDGTGLINFCIPRPDKLEQGNVQLGSDVHVTDVTGDANGCTFTLNSTTVPLGTVGSIGLCDNGGNTAGFALVFAGNLVLSRDCSGTTDNVPVQLVGTVAVSVP